MSKRTVLVLLALAAVAALCAAQDTSLAVEKIVVTATRIAGTILASPDHITVVSGEELAGALSAAEALESVAGVSVSDNGTVGSVQSVSLRGSAAAQVLVLVDGVRLNDSRQGAPDLSQIPVDNIERIEIVRGGTSALYGADAVAGVVNIITKDKAEDRFRLSLTNGSYLPRDAARCEDGVGADTGRSELPGPGGHAEDRGAAFAGAGCRWTCCSRVPSRVPTTASSGTTIRYIDGYRRRDRMPACWKPMPPVPHCACWGRAAPG